ncbi:TetR/AcrR family transcriptional regulator [Naasia aerilata]|uniref:TetR family transcriptional regulator n=1 Tax=Naasia aerilata TaxID=1162966 RepID=A0ABN6XI34_9MICO|nr:TetR/AcrR family transcriptional regulator [Naasia aerilata]BDZ44529.1 TetR family transcriptional regulator [Naasia aerilata]
MSITEDTEALPPGPGDPAEPGLRERKKRQTRQALHEAAVRLIGERGLAGVTVEEICAEAGVSPRTFFNYFPSKGNAALGLPVVLVTEDVRRRFLAGGPGGLVDDLCDLAAHTFELPSERIRMKDLVRSRPELVPMVLRWMADLRLAIVAAAVERTDEQTARTAATLVMAALVEAVHRWNATSPDELAGRIRTVVAEMGALVRA